MSLHDKVHFCSSLLTSGAPQCFCIVKEWICAGTLLFKNGEIIFSALKNRASVAMNKFTFLHLAVSLNSYPCFWGKHLLESLLLSNHSKVGGNIWALLGGRWHLMPGWWDLWSGSCWRCDQNRVCAGGSRGAICWCLASLADSQHKCDSSSSSCVSQTCLKRASLLLPMFTCCRFALKNPLLPVAGVSFERPP